MLKKERRLFYLYYSLIFVMLSGMIALFYYSQGKSLIDWGGDGFRQHYRALVYYSDYLKTIISNIVHGIFKIPNWDFAIGEGNDIISTFHYYGLGDFFTFFCFLFPRNKMHICYDLAIFARMYFSGITFSWLCFYKNKKNYLLIAGCAIIYAFCPFSFANLSSHVFFISAAVYLPAIILGVEKIINKDEPYFLPVAVMFSALSNIYFFYMNVVSTVVYVLIRLAFLNSGFKNKIFVLIKIAAFSLLGVLMSAIIFFPMFYTMISNSRLDARMNFSMFYQKWDYINMFTDFVFAENTYYGGFTVLGLLSLPKLLKKEKLCLLTMFVTGTLFACLPFIGRVYNAMVSPTDRWLYAISLLMCYIIIDLYDDISAINDGRILNLLVSILYFSVCIYFKHNWQIFILFFITSISLLLCSLIIKKKNILNHIVLGVVIFSILFNIIYQYSPFYWNMARYGTDIEKAESIRNGENEVFDYLGDENFFRYSGDSLVTNENIHGDYSSTQFYWSIVNDYVVKFRKELGLPDRSNHHYKNYDDRYGLNMLAGVKYYLYNNNGLLPYGYDDLKKTDDGNLFISEDVLPLVYAYDSYLTDDEWAKLDVVEKNEAILQVAMVNKPVLSLKEKKPDYSYREIDFKLDCHEGVSFEDGTIFVSNADSAIELKCSNIGSGEYYLVVEGLDSDESPNLEIIYGDINKTLYFKGRNNPHYADRHDYIVNLGYLNEINGTISITIPEEGIYRYDDIRVICQPLDNQIDSVRKLKEIIIDDLSVSSDYVKATITLKDDRLVCFAIPYSRGWKAKVDGKDAEVLNCNIQYMAVEVGKGDHVVELSYSTPMQKCGFFTSIISGALLIYLKKRNFFKDKTTFQ